MRFAVYSLALAVSFFASSAAHAQIPGSWQRTTICTPCNSPVGFDFSDKSTGVVMLESQRLFGTPHKTIVYSSTNSGATWSVHFDTLPYKFRHGLPVVLHGKHLVVMGFEAALHSDDFGESFDAKPTEYLKELDFISPSPAVIFRAVQPLDNLHRVDFLVSRDSGNTYSKLDTLVTSKFYPIIDVRFKDTNEFWARLPASYQGDSTKTTRLIYSRDQGRHWVDVYPFDTTEMRGSNMTFGNSALLKEGLIPGVEPGSFYLLQNWSTLRKTYIDLLITTDYGVTWYADSSHTHKSAPIFDHIFLRNSGGSRIWTIFTDMQTVAYSPDNGRTWDHDSVTFRGSQIKNMLWKDSATGYILTFSSDSTVTLWTFVPGSSGVDHHTGKHKNVFFELPSSVATNGKIRVEAMQPLSGQLTAFDILGRIAWNRFVRTERSQSIEVEVPQSTGVYFLNYSDGERQQTARFIQP